MTCPNPEMNPFFNMPEDEKEDILIDVKVISNSSQSKIVLEDKFIEKEKTKFKIYVNSPALKNKANEEIIYILSLLLNKKKSELKIVKGLKSNHKTIKIEKITYEHFIKQVEDGKK